MGNIPGSLAALTISMGDADWILAYRVQKGDNAEREFCVDTRDLKRELDDIPMSSPRVAGWLEKYVAEGLAGIGAEGSGFQEN